MDQIELGDVVEDRITGVRGCVTARSEYLNGCVRFQVEGRIDADDDVNELREYWFDHERLVVVEAGWANVKQLRGLRSVGGSRSGPPRTGY